MQFYVKHVDSSDAFVFFLERTKCVSFKCQTLTMLFPRPKHAPLTTSSTSVGGDNRILLPIRQEIRLEGLDAIYILSRVNSGIKKR